MNEDELIKLIIKYAMSNQFEKDKNDPNKTWSCWYCPAKVKGYSNYLIHIESHQRMTETDLNKRMTI